MLNSRSRHRLRLAAPAVAALLATTTLAACSGDDNDNDGALRVTTLGLCNEIPVYWAQEKGLFDEHDVEVELVKSTGGAAALTALQSGDIDLAFANPFSTMIALDQGLDLKWIATAYETTTDEAKSANAVVVSESSGHFDAESLNGATIGVNEIGGINEIITRHWLSLAGGDPDSVKFVALPFNELASAVATDKVAAAQIPKQNVDPELGLASLGDPYIAAGEGGGLVFAGYVSTSKQVDKREDDLSGFQAALIEANEAINDGSFDDERFKIAAERCKNDAEVLKTLPENIYEAKVDVDALARMGAILEGQGRLDSAPPVSDFVPGWVTTK